MLGIRLGNFLLIEMILEAGKAAPSTDYSNDIAGDDLIKLLMKTPTLIPLNWFNRCFWGCLWFNHW
jgi:hypothetical protein